MEKRKFKLNVLDVVIFIAVVCSVVALVFRSDINAALSKPESVIITVNVTAVNDENARVYAESIFDIGNNITFDINTQTRAVVSQTNQENLLDATVILNGYTKLGRCYTESGDLLEIGTNCTILYGDGYLHCKVQSYEIMG